MVDAPDAKMNSNMALSSENDRDAYACESILVCAQNGDYVDIDDVKKHIASPKPREFTLCALRDLFFKTQNNS